MLQKLRTHREPQGFRPKTRANMERACYPFGANGLQKLLDLVGAVGERLMLALEVLQLDVGSGVRERLTRVEHSIAGLFMQGQSSSRDYRA